MAARPQLPGIEARPRPDTPARRVIRIIRIIRSYGTAAWHCATCRACPASEPCRARAKGFPGKKFKDCLLQSCCHPRIEGNSTRNSTRGNSEKMGHACFQFRTPRGQQPKNGWCLFPVPRHFESISATYAFQHHIPARHRRLRPSAPGTQLMSRTNYEAVADFAGHWLHRAQISLLTGEIGQIKLIHIRKKTLVRAWCGLQDRSRGAGLAPRPKPRSRPRSQGHPRTVTRAETCAEEGLVCLTHQQAATPVRGCVKHTNPRITEETSPNGRTPRRTCEGALRKYNTPAL